MTHYSCIDIKDSYEVRYKALADASPLGLILIDLSGEILEVNRAAVEILGSPSVEETKQVNMFTYPPIMKSGISSFLLKVIESSSALEGIFDYTTKWGSSLHMKCIANLVRDNQSEPCYILFIIEDLSEVDKLKEKFYKISQTLIKIVDSLETFYVWAKDVDGVYHVVSKSYAKLFNKEPLDIVGLNDFDLFPEPMAQKFMNDDKEVLVTCGVKEICEIVDTPIVGPRHWRTIKNAICDDNNSGILTVGIAEDVEDQFILQRNAKKAIKELESFVKRNALTIE